ncbi:hypothetical protein LWI29_030429 [Acer saccharum]|uniref:Uncharacterized protein n=1 Tax=Acer saccharum TaxID=4024 RepID=A0AA39W390_ACESA|nr:hypothetical protein LWI29_030429 [Acer saccharum]
MVDGGGKLIEVPDPEDSAYLVISGSNLESPIVPLPNPNPITPPPDSSPNQNLPILSYPNPNSSPIQTQSIQRRPENLLTVKMKMRHLIVVRCLLTQNDSRRDRLARSVTFR